MIEMGAYEFLWTERGQTFKTLADRFRDESVPSDFVLPGIAEEYAHRATGLLLRGSVEHFGLRIKGAGEYPSRLRDARSPLEVLYFQGWWDLVETPCVAVVGTRNPTEDGIARTRKITRELVKDGFTVVSGLASGIDAAAHISAIEAGGQTIGVIGTPLSQAYPKENSELQRLVASDYLLISQVPVIRHSQQDWRQNRAFFPQRNVTMSALTQATIIVEASDTSGTLMQAKAALHQKRKLFILDSCFRDPSLEWPHKYAAEGAIRVKDYQQIRENLGEAAKD